MDWQTWVAGIVVATCALQALWRLLGVRGRRIVFGRWSGSPTAQRLTANPCACDSCPAGRPTPGTMATSPVRIVRRQPDRPADASSITFGSDRCQTAPAGSHTGVSPGATRAADR